MTDPFTLVAARAATMADPGLGPGEGPLQVLDNVAVVVDGERIAWVGPHHELPSQWSGIESVDLGGRLLSPGLVEAHAHLIYGGGDAEELDLWTRVECTRAASDEELYREARARVDGYVAQGVTTMELKTGFGQDAEHELRLLDLAARLRDDLPIAVRITLLAGHVYPPGVGEDEREDYVIDVCEGLLMACAEHGGYDAVEVYCEEERGLTMEDCSTILETVYRKKVPTRVAADQVSDSAGGALAPAFYAKAAIHLNFTDDIAVKAMGNVGTTAVLVPRGAGSTPSAQRPPVTLLREHGVPLAVSTGREPGPSAQDDLLGAARRATEQFGLTTAEALRGITREAARALGLDSTGKLQVGGAADLVAWEVEDPDELLTRQGPIEHRTWAAGRELSVDLQEVDR